MKHIVHLVFLLFCFKFVFSQYKTENIPLSIRLNLALNPISEIKVPMSSKRNETDNQRQEWIVGNRVKTDINFLNSGTWTILPNKDRVWQLKLSIENAKYIILYYNNFTIPAGCEFNIYSTDLYSDVKVIKTQQKAFRKEKFVTIPTKGSDVILEYYESISSKDQGKISISYIGKVFSNLYETDCAGFGCSQSCQTNVRCPDIPNGYCFLHRSVAMIIKPYENEIRQATGALINNIKYDGHPYFLTVDHILDGNESQWIFAFNYESPNCDDIDKYLFANSITGASVLTHSYTTDCALLELHERVPPEFNPFYCGWFISGQPISAVMIHHPKGDIKKLAIAETIKNPIGSPTYWKVKNWSKGIPEPGSSGAPLFSGSYIRGIQSMAPSDISCSNDDGAHVKKLEEAWDGANLGNWLYPNKPDDIVGIGGNDPCVNHYEFENRNNLHDDAYEGYYTAVDYIEVSNSTIQQGTVTFDAGNRIVLGPGFNVEKGVVFNAKIDGCQQICFDELEKQSLDKQVITRYNISKKLMENNIRTDKK